MISSLICSKLSVALTEPLLVAVVSPRQPARVSVDVLVGCRQRREKIWETGSSGVRPAHGRSPVNQASFGRTDNTLAMKVWNSSI